MHFEISPKASDVITAAEELYGEEDAVEWRWALKRDDGETVLSSDGFESQAACRAAIDAVKATGAHAEAGVRVVKP